VQIE
jgi:arsenate reductase-like glutaredoxin family protein